MIPKSRITCLHSNPDALPSCRPRFVAEGAPSFGFPRIGRASQTSGSRQGTRIDTDRIQSEQPLLFHSNSLCAGLWHHWSCDGRFSQSNGAFRAVPPSFDAQLSRLISQLQIKSKTISSLAVVGVEEWVWSSGRASRSRFASAQRGTAPLEKLRTGTNTPHFWIEAAGGHRIAAGLMSSRHPPLSSRSFTISQDWTIPDPLVHSNVSLCSICAPLIASIN